MRWLDLACPSLERGGDQRRPKSVIRDLGKKIIDEGRTRRACCPLFSSRKDTDAAPPEEDKCPGNWALDQIGLRFASFVAAARLKRASSTVDSYEAEEGHRPKLATMSTYSQQPIIRGTSPLHWVSTRV